MSRRNVVRQRDTRRDATLLAAGGMTGVGSTTMTQPHRARSLDTLPDIDRAVTLVMRDLLARDTRTHAEIAAAMGVPRTTMTGALHGKQRWSLSTLDLLCRELGVPVALVMTRAGYGPA